MNRKKILFFFIIDKFEFFVSGKQQNEEQESGECVNNREKSVYSHIEVLACNISVSTTEIAKGIFRCMDSYVGPHAVYFHVWNCCITHNLSNHYMYGVVCQLLE